MVRERRNWTAEEDARLKNAVELARRGDSQSLPWNAIALSVPGRTNKDCRKRFHYKVSSNANRGAWTRTEDERLRGAVQKYGFKWCRVAIDVGTRNGDQCSKRWQNTIDPRIDHSAWSSQDEQLLTQTVRKKGHDWKAIVTDYFPGRTALQARNQYNHLCRQTGRSTQPSMPGSIQGPSTALSADRPLSHIPSTHTESIGANSQSPSIDADMEYDESDYDQSSEAENDADDKYDGDWPQSKICSQWDPASEASCMQTSQSPSRQYAISPPDFDHISSPVPNHGMMLLSSYGYLGNSQTLEQPPNHSYTVSGHALSAEPSSQLQWINLPDNIPLGVDSATSTENKKEVVIAATCSNSEVRKLIQTTAEALESVSFAVTSQDGLPANEMSQSLNGSRHILITASCLPDKLGKLIQMVTATMSSVSFTVNSSTS